MKILEVRFACMDGCGAHSCRFYSYPENWSPEAAQKAYEQMAEMRKGWMKERLLVFQSLRDNGFHAASWGSQKYQESLAKARAEGFGKHADRIEELTRLMKECDTNGTAELKRIHADATMSVRT